MKLVFCPECEDLFRLIDMPRRCLCGVSGGRYLDKLEAVVWGKAVPIGFDNKSFVSALLQRPESGPGRRFDAFVIALECDTISNGEPEKNE